MSEITRYPEFTGLTMEMRPVLHPMLRSLKDGISEFTFANLYLFRRTHSYGVAMLEDGLLAVSGADRGRSFFMLPAGLPGEDTLEELFRRFTFLKCASAVQAGSLARKGYAATEDRDNFDYVYLREELKELRGRKFHRKKNLVNYFTGTYNYEARPLLDEYLADAKTVLESWRGERESPGDYDAAREALDKCYELQLCGGIYYVDNKPAAYTLGEELTEDTFAVHFEKDTGDYKGLAQFVNQSFTAILPEKYRFVNREQDLGDPGLRKAKMSYRPAGFVKKFIVTPAR